MGKINRGGTTKLSVKLSTSAKQKIENAAKNLNLSKAGVILFELTKILENPPSRTDILNLENKIILEPEHFVLTVNESLMNRLNALAEEYGMKKNVLYGLLISNHFEDMEGNNQLDADPKKIMIQVNENLKKKMIKYSEENYIPLSGLIAYSISEGPFNGIPVYKEGETEKFFSSVPGSVYEIIKTRAEEMNIREHFYVSLCLYKQFMTEEGRFKDR
jgi:hypothetical protein